MKAIPPLKEVVRNAMMCILLFPGLVGCFFHALHVDEKEWRRGRGCHGQGATCTMVTASEAMGDLSIEAHLFALWL